VLPLWLGRRLALSGLAALHRRGYGVSRALVVGEGPTARALEERLAERSWTGIRVAARLPGPDGLRAAVERARASQVFLALPAERHDDTARALSILAGEMVDVRIVPDLGEASPINPGVALLSGLPVITFQESPFHGTGRFVKRTFDLVATSVLLLPLLPVAALCALAVLVGSGRPVLYRQERMGLDGRRFVILKFRTMRADAEERSGAVWATRGDPRVTAVGRLLRRLSLDELPQLVNVLKGDMSLVGPRPERPVFIEKFRKRLPRYMLRHRIPAGLTGWAQVSGCRGDTDVAERLRYDLRYLEEWSILLDVEILLRTVWHVLSGRNAV
jgi:exopolysaccharide biosynthesis polyprenyl glycosylphosphotransferase